MDTVPEKSATSPGSDEETLDHHHQHLPSAFLCSTCHSLLPLTGCVFMIWAFSALGAEIWTEGYPSCSVLSSP